MNGSIFSDEKQEELISFLVKLCNEAFAKNEKKFEERYMQPAATAIYMGVSGATVRRLKKDGKLKTIIIRGTELYDRKDIDEMMLVNKLKI